ncbi:TrkH family potassium uptake protein [Veillonella criceti]|uniref:Trk system potassium uptake protein trkG n=1 Tax=Veillonella criceti TaxID=103891 RepID=A0A380NH68_9FIRM|nr:TrkH family potassium uptake protein [Veillonella criceti]SUP40597.1 Trk system potassium uptake protein trkG [Veillonella criceti]
MRIQIVMHLVGQLILIVAAIMLVPFCYGLVFEEIYVSFLLSSLVAAITGGLLYYYGEPSTSYSLRDGFLTVSSIWILVSFFAALPFYFGGVLPSFIDALFESVSGITATGASVVPDIDALPQSYVLWRSLTHWLGGMGIVVLVLAFLKNLGADSAHLFNAEASVPRPGVVLPRIRSMAFKLWTIYLLFTAVCFTALCLAGMGYFDAVNMTFTTIATGGYTPNTGVTDIYSENGIIRGILIFFMILAGGNFTVYYAVFQRGLQAVWQDFEYRMYLLILGIGIFIVALSLFFGAGETISNALNHATFMLVSMQTGSGLVLGNYDIWPPLAQMMLFSATFFGGCSGSTTGGIKIIRIIILIKSVIIYLRKAIHPDIVQSITINGKRMPQKWVQMTQEFFFLYMTVFAISALGISATGLSFGESLQCVAGILGNVGLAFGALGPEGSFSILHPIAKVICIVDMLLGRLELFTLLVLLHPDFWQGYFLKRRKRSYKVWQPTGTHRRL